MWPQLDSGAGGVCEPKPVPGPHPDHSTPPPACAYALGLPAEILGPRLSSLPQRVPLPPAPVCPSAVRRPSTQRSTIAAPSPPCTNLLHCCAGVQAFRPELGYWDLYYNGETSPALLGDSLTSVRALTQTKPIRTLAEVDSMYDSLSCECAAPLSCTPAPLRPCTPIPLPSSAVGGTFISWELSHSYPNPPTAHRPVTGHQ